MYKYETIVFDLDGTVFQKKLKHLQNFVSVLQSKPYCRWIVRFFLFLYEVIEFFAVMCGMKFKINYFAQQVINKKVHLEQMRKYSPLMPGFNLLIMTNRSYLGLLSLYRSGCFSFGFFDAIQVRGTILNYCINSYWFGVEPEKMFQCWNIKPSDAAIKNIISNQKNSNDKVVLIDNDARMRNLAQQHGIKVATMEEVAKMVYA